MLIGHDERGRGDRALRWLSHALDGIAEAAWPTTCAWCGEPGTLLCEGCARGMPWVSQHLACPACGAPYGWLTCTACKREWQGPPVVCATGFGDASARVVTTLKDWHETRLAPVMAAAMACALDEASPWGLPGGGSRWDPADVDAICFVPATAEAHARRGFDHMRLVAHALGGFLGIGVADVLARGPSLDQRGLGRASRERNLAGSVRVVDDVCGARLLLVDDVVTTGASLAACERALLSAGSAPVRACAFARVW